MTVKRVVCPKCNEAMNVVASMTSVKCKSCQHVFQLDASGSRAVPSSAVGNAAAAGPMSPSDDDTGLQTPSGLQAIIIAGSLFAVVLIGFAVLAVINSPSGAKVSPTDPPKIEQDSLNSENTAADGAVAVPTPEYRVVDLSETARKRIYKDYRQTFDSSLGKAKRIPQGGKAGQSLNSMLGQTVDREITHLSLLNNISEDDVRQIAAEGEAKGW